MIDSVTFTGYYTSRAEVPTIGQRRRMQLNGKTQMLTLNHITAKRRHLIEDNKWVTEFTTEETWGQFY